MWDNLDPCQKLKNKFRKLVYSQLREVAKDFLTTLKEKHSKLDQRTNEYKLDIYLCSNKISTEDKQNLFRMRTRMVDVRSNFKTQYGQNLACPFCAEEETQSHLLNCQQITVGIDVSQVEYSDVFKDVNKQEAISKIFTRILKQRSLKLKILSRDS